MADKTINLMNLRAAIQQSNVAWTQVLLEAGIFATMGWIQADFDAICAGTDISSADLFTALASIGTINTAFADEQAALTKLLP